MAKEQEIALNDEDSSEQSSEEQDQPEDTIRQVLDERDFITPLKEVQDEPLDPVEPHKSAGSAGAAEQEIELSLDGVDFQMDDDQTNTADENAFEDDGPGTDEAPELKDPADGMPEKNDNLLGDDEDTDRAEKDGQEPEALPETDLSGEEPVPKKKLPNAEADENMENDFVALAEDELDVKPPEAKKVKPQVDSPKIPNDSKPGKAAADKAKGETPPAKSKPKAPSKKPASKSEAPSASNQPSMVNKMIGFVLVGLVIAGYIFYNNPALIGLKKVSEPTPTPVPEVAQPVQPAPAQIVETPSPPSPHDNLMAKLEEATDLRNQLLEKRTEIDKLNLYYRNGIAELEENIFQEAQEEGISSFEQALKNKRIELNLRTIQRRRAYILELEKPTQWVDSGSEELLYLIRKAQLDLELIDIAGGIDINKHQRHISAAVNQYRPTADKLAINLQDDKLTPLEIIWQQASINKNIKSTNAQIALNPKDDQIAAEICSGNLGRMAELTRISADTARCLSRMKGSDLFLNAVTQLPPDAAKELFQWQGNWICLNGVKELSPAVAKYLFKWGGNWISLNGLNEFQPELAEYLLKWEGQQLELMGLKYNKTDAQQKTLKYLSLWETTGGKLFVPDGIRKEMGRIMVSQFRRQD
jgi:hypothetical protein